MPGIESRLQELHIDLPEVTPAGNYIPVQRTGNLLYVSGQLPKVEGRIAFKGRVGEDLHVESARRAAKACLANILSVMNQELGSLDKVKMIVKLTGYINTYPG